MSQITNGIYTFVKANFFFGLGMIIGSIIGTTTTIIVTMGYYGVSETITNYQQLVCGAL